MTSDRDSAEQRLAAALHARAAQGGRIGWPSSAPGPAVRSGIWSTGGAQSPSDPVAPPLAQVTWALVLALLAGAVLGCALALLSVLVPGLLPALG